MVRGPRHILTRGGRFFGQRVNCERVPLLPAWALAQVLDDPEKAPYSVICKTPGDKVGEAIRLAPCREKTDPGRFDLVELTRPEGTVEIIRTILRPLPRNGGRSLLLICPRCGIPRRGLYGWRPGGQFTSSVVDAPWACRTCNGLRYASEGGGLVIRGRGALARMFEGAFGDRSERPESWYPEIKPIRPKRPPKE